MEQVRTVLLMLRVKPPLQFPWLHPQPLALGQAVLLERVALGKLVRPEFLAPLEPGLPKEFGRSEDLPYKGRERECGTWNIG